MSHQRWDITGLWNCILALFSALKGTAFNLINIVLKEGSLIDRNIIVPFFYPCAFEKPAFNELGHTVIVNVSWMLNIRPEYQ